MSLKKQFFKSNAVCKVTFSLPKEAVGGAENVKLLGDFNSWKKDKAVPMKIKNGAFFATVKLKAGEEYQFRYLLDNERWENDWDADKYTPNPFGIDNSVVVTSK